MLKEKYCPDAYLSSIKNVKKGLKVRTQILRFLTLRNATIKMIENEIRRSYRVIFHHLKRLEKEKIVQKTERKPFFWEITGIGQKNLNNWV